MAMSAEQAEARINVLETKLADVILELTGVRQQLEVSTNEHKRVHSEMERLEKQKGGSHIPFRLIDPKTMSPDKFGLKAGPGWHSWSASTRAFIEMLDVKMANAMKEVEGHEQPMPISAIASAGISDEVAAQVSRYLLVRTEGHANSIVKAA